MAFYEALGFTALVGIREGRLHGGATPMFLDMTTLAAAVNAAG